MSKSYVFYVDGISCTSCTNTIEHAVKQNSKHKIEYFHVDLAMASPKKTTIILAEDIEAPEAVWEELKGHIDAVGFDCKAASYQPTAPKSTPEKKPSSLESFKQFISSHWFLGTLGSSVGLALLITFLVASNLPLAVMIGLASLSTILTLALGANSYYDAWKKLTKAKTLTMDSLFTISTLTVIAVSITSFFVPWLPMMFEAGLLIYGFRHIGLAIEETLKEKIRPGRFQDRAGQTVRLALTNSVHEIPLNYAKTQDLIVIHPGELIPLDGLCEQDTAIYDTILSGSPLPHHYRKGTKVLAGMQLASDAQPLKIKVLNNAQSSYLARLDTGIEQSMLEKTPLELKTQKLLSYFIPTVIAIAAIAGIGLSFFFPAAIAIQCAISVLVSACPCTLGLVIPLAVKTGIHKAAEHGVYFKGSKTLQEAEQIDTVLFDLNGTLTHGVPSVTSYGLTSPSKLSIDEFFTLCASLENTAEHPFAKAIYSHSQKYKPNTLEIKEVNKKNHSGVTGFINGEQYAIGGAKLMRQQGVELNQLDKLEAGDSVVYLARGTVLLGHIVLTDPLRKDAIETIKHLQALKKEIYICTGSDEQTAQRYAKTLGIDEKNIYANCLATTIDGNDEAKPSKIKLLQQQNKKVAMIGDAANDAHALAASNLGIAVLSQNSDELTQKHAGAVIPNDSLTRIISIFELSKQTVSNINQNLGMSIGYNLGALAISGGLLVAVGLMVSPAIGAALMIIQACIVLGNVYRFKQQPLKHVVKSEPEEKLEHSSFQQMHQCANLRPSPTKELSLDCKDEGICATPLFHPTKKASLEPVTPRATHALT